MKKTVLGLSLFAVLLVTSCSGTSGGGVSTPSEIRGTWVYTGSYTETITVNSDTVSITDAGFVNGTGKLAVKDVDAANGHLLCSMASTTGDWTIIPAGTTYYVTYILSGTTAQIGYSVAAYPVSPSNSYTKQ